MSPPIPKLRLRDGNSGSALLWTGSFEGFFDPFFDTFLAAYVVVNENPCVRYGLQEKYDAST